MGAPNNRTLQLSGRERSKYARQLLRPSGIHGAGQLVDRLILGDALELIPSLPPAFADLIIVDPPYNLTRHYGETPFHQKSSEDYAHWLQSWVPGLKRLLKAEGSLYVCCDWRCGSAIHQELAKHFHVQNRITWEREKGRGARANWKSASEDIWFCTQDPDRYYFDVDSVKLRRRVRAPYRTKGVPKDWQETKQGNFRSTHPSNLWTDLTVPFWSMPENTDHPTQKPEKLIAKLILASAPPGAVVLDPFVGSGTTAVVARKLGRHFVGIDLEEDYLCWAAKRLELASIHPEIQGYADSLFWERNSLPKRRTARAIGESASLED